MSDVLDTAYQSQDLEGNLHWLGDKYARERLDATYTKEESDEIFRRKDDSLSASTIHDLVDVKADKDTVYTKTETDDLLDELEDRSRVTFANIRATIAQLDSNTEIHFQNLEQDLDDNYYTKLEIDGIAEELDRTKQNKLHPGDGITMTQRLDGSWDIDQNIIDDESIGTDKTWSAQKLQDLANRTTDAEDDIDSLETRMQTAEDSYVPYDNFDEERGLSATPTAAFVKVDGTSIEFNTQGELRQVPSALSIPVGVILPYGGITAPPGWLMCDGNDISRNDYANLFAVIGDQFGQGDGILTFNLPDMREAVPKGAGLQQLNTVGSHMDNDGLTVGEFLDDRVQTHHHSVSVPAQWVDRNGVTSGSNHNLTSSTYTTTNNTGRTGDTTEVKSVGVNYIIKY